VVSVCVGQPRTLEWRGQRFTSAILKQPVEGAVAIAAEGLEGDGHGDPSVHGGPWKAVYAYPSEHYPPWQRELGLAVLAPGSFGENLATSGLDEASVAVGDLFRAGTALLQVTHPRLPCARLIARFQRDDIGKRMLESKRTGFYLRVREPGRTAAGDALDLVERDTRRVSVADLLGLYTHRVGDAELLERVLAVDAVPDSWRRQLRERGALELRAPA
jgi:MOSC domain-containing protein YiiM